MEFLVFVKEGGEVRPLRLQGRTSPYECETLCDYEASVSSGEALVGRDKQEEREMVMRRRRK